MPSCVSSTVICLRGQMDSQSFSGSAVWNLKACSRSSGRAKSYTQYPCLQAQHTSQHTAGNGSTKYVVLIENRQQH